MTKIALLFELLKFIVKLYDFLNNSRAEDNKELVQKVKSLGIEVKEAIQSGNTQKIEDLIKALKLPVAAK